jgi:hypothetical protein
LLGRNLHPIAELLSKYFLDGDPDRSATTVWSVSAGNRLFGPMPSYSMEFREVSFDQRANKTGRLRGHDVR